MIALLARGRTATAVRSGWPILERTGHEQYREYHDAAPGRPSRLASWICHSPHGASKGYQMCLADLRLGGDLAKLTDFVQRFEQGPPWDSFDVNEADFRYRQVSGHLSTQEYNDAVCAVLGRLEPRERRQFAHMVADRCATKGLEFDSCGDDYGPDCYEDPRTLAGLISQLREGCQSSGGLGLLLAGRDGLCKVVLGGIAASALQQL